MTKLVVIGVYTLLLKSFHREMKHIYGKPHKTNAHLMGYCKVNTILTTNWVKKSKLAIII